MSIQPVSGVTSTGYLAALNPSSAVTSVGDGGFSDVLSGAVNSLTQAQSTSNELAIKPSPVTWTTCTTTRSPPPRRSSSWS